MTPKSYRWVRPAEAFISPFCTAYGFLRAMRQPGNPDSPKCTPSDGVHAEDHTADAKVRLAPLFGHASMAGKRLPLIFTGRVMLSSASEGGAFLRQHEASPTSKT